MDVLAFVVCVGIFIFISAAVFWHRNQTRDGHWHVGRFGEMRRYTSNGWQTRRMTVAEASEDWKDSAI